MIDLYYWTTPNGHKITLFLEEAGLPYTIHPVNLSRGDQFKPEFLAISPKKQYRCVNSGGISYHAVAFPRGMSLSMCETG